MEEDAMSHIFAVHRSLNVLLRPVEEELRKAIFKILSKLDKVFSKDLGTVVDRSMFCRQGQQQGDHMCFFDLEEGMSMKSFTKPCSQLTHKPDKRQSI